MDWAFLAIGGFLLGVFFYTGYYTTRYEPEVSGGYGVVGIGILSSVAINSWIDFKYRGVSDWFRGATLLSWTVVAVGLALILHERRGRKK